MESSKLELHNVAISTTSVPVEEGEQVVIPPNLAKLTETILKLHKVNGDLDWVGDMVHEIRLQAGFGMGLGNMSPSSLIEIAKGFVRAKAVTDDPDERVDIETNLSLIRDQISTLIGVDGMEAALRNM